MVTDSEESKDEDEFNDKIFEPCSNQSVSKRRNLFNPELCQVADKYQISHRALTELVFADKVTNENSNQVTLSVMNCKRQRDSVRSATASKIKQKIKQSISNPDSLFLLQWDRKLLEGLKHVSKSVEHVAIILHSLGKPSSDKILSITGLNNKPNTAENEASLILDELQNYPAIKNKIIGFCFDTTAVNTGLRNKIIVRVQHHFGRKLLLFACRHHIFELCCGAECREVFGSTTSPFENVFTVLQTNCDKINTDQFDLIDVNKLPRHLQRRREEVMLFGRQFLESGQHSHLLRKDYKEFCA